ncbi:hypothetical protein [Sphingomonas montana]|uniref:hypothetical protein n=1 Tax=Sphingomonas montana TaxID=1843236 RepID=UPI00101AE6EC|nr:hypothetical protein [Sphingomonas montana]
MSSLVTASLILAACGQGGSNETAATASADPVPVAVDPTSATGSVVRDTARPAPAPAPVVTPIQTQQGPEGTRVDLTRAAVTGDILTVQLAYTAASDKSFSDYFRADEVSVIDDATSQRYGILKDQTGAWLAAPLFVSHSIRASGQKGETAIVWMKFPAPPATSRAVSVNVPKVGPFDGVPISRQQ